MKRWTIFFVSHDTARTWTVEVPGTVLKLAGAAALATAAAVLVGLTLASSRAPELPRGLLPDGALRALSIEASRLGLRPPAPQDGPSVLPHRADEAGLGVVLPDSTQPQARRDTTGVRARPVPGMDPPPQSKADSTP